MLVSLGDTILDATEIWYSKSNKIVIMASPDCYTVEGFSLSQYRKLKETALTSNPPILYLDDYHSYDSKAILYANLNNN